MMELRSPPVPDRPPIQFTSVRASRFRFRGVSTQDLPEWMGLWAPGVQPRPLTVAHARSFMARDAPRP